MWSMAEVIGQILAWGDNGVPLSDYEAAAARFFLIILKKWKEDVAQNVVVSLCNS